MWRRRSLALLVWLVAAPAFAQTSWIETSIVGFNPDNSKAPTALYFGGDFPAWDDAAAIPYALTPDTWHLVTLPYTVPADAKAVFLSGLLILTNPSTIGICNLTVTFRAPGSTWDSGNYQLQTASTAGSGGSRAPASTFAPVVNRQFEVYHTRTPGCPALVNLSLQAYFRGSASSTPPPSTPPSITASVGSVISGTVANGPANPTDWVGLCQATCISWKYLTNTQTAGAGVSAATVTFPLPAAGTYTLKFFANDSFTVIAQSAPFTVGGQ